MTLCYTHSIHHANNTANNPNVLINLPQPHSRISLHKPQIHLMTEQVANVVDAIPDHRGTFERQAPTEHSHVLTVEGEISHSKDSGGFVTELMEGKMDGWGMCTYGKPIASSISGRNIPLFPISTDLPRPASGIGVLAFRT